MMDMLLLVLHLRCGGLQDVGGGGLFSFGSRFHVSLKDGRLTLAYISFIPGPSGR